MNSNRLRELKGLYSSQGGAHFTAYIQNDHADLGTLRSSLVSAYEHIYDQLGTVMSPERIYMFARPIQSLILNSREIESKYGTIGLFRNETSFKMVHMPFSQDSFCGVASTFHIKPLLEWAQRDRDFILIGLDGERIHFYKGSHTHFEHLFSEPFSVGARKCKNMLRDGVDSWVRETNAIVYVQGLDARRVSAQFKDVHTHVLSSEPAFCFGEYESILKEIRAHLTAETERSIDLSLMEFYLSDELRLAQNDLRTIARLAAQGKIKKLLIAQDVKLFGRFDSRDGSLILHGDDLDHEDDDVLDDIAQSVLIQGGEVVVTPSNKIPRNVPALAILRRGHLSQSAFVQTQNETKESRVSV